MNRELKLVSDSVIVSCLYTMTRIVIVSMVDVSQSQKNNIFLLVHTLGFSTNLAFLYVSERDLG